MRLEDEHHRCLLPGKRDECQTETRAHECNDEHINPSWQFFHLRGTKDSAFFAPPAVLFSVVVQRAGKPGPVPVMVVVMLFGMGVCVP